MDSDLAVIIAVHAIGDDHITKVVPNGKPSTDAAHRQAARAESLHQFPRSRSDGIPPHLPGPRKRDSQESTVVCPVGSPPVGKRRLNEGAVCAVINGTVVPGPYCVVFPSSGGENPNIHRQGADPGRRGDHKHSKEGVVSRVLGEIPRGRQPDQAVVKRGRHLRIPEARLSPWKWNPNGGKSAVYVFWGRALKWLFLQ